MPGAVASERKQFRPRGQKERAINQIITQIHTRMLKGTIIVPPPGGVLWKGLDGSEDIEAFKKAQQVLSQPHRWHRAEWKNWKNTFFFKRFKAFSKPKSWSRLPSKPGKYVLYFPQFLEEATEAQRG